jgi:uncharacterized membrane protein
MKVLKIVFALVGVFIALIVVASSLIPAERSFTNEIEINAPAEKVWQVINDRTRFPEWQTNLTRVEVLDDKNWVEYPKDSPEPLRFTLAKDVRPSRMEFAYKMGDSFDGKWTGDITPTADGVRLKTVDSYAANGTMTKILIGIFFDLDKFAKDWNNKLKERVEKTQ